MPAQPKIPPPPIPPVARRATIWPESFPLGPCLVLLLALAICGLDLSYAWGKWDGFLAGFGREIYIPWQIAAGKTLYRDLSYAYGPLPPYFQALLFHLFGPSLDVILISNAVVLLLLLLAAARLVIRITDFTVAICAMLVVVVASGLNHMTGIATFNLLTPYSHALTYGLTLTLFTLLVLDRYARKPGAGTAAGSGILTGLTLLTTPVAAIALGLPLVLAVLLLLRSVKTLRRDMGLFLLGAFFPPVVAYSCLSIALSPGQAFFHLSRIWPLIGEGTGSFMPFYPKDTFGSVAFMDNLRSMDLATVAHTVIAALVTIQGMLAVSLERRLPEIGRYLAMLPIPLIYGLMPTQDCIDLTRSLPRAWPILLLLLFFWALVRLWRKPRDTQEKQRLFVLVLLTSLALGFCLKIFFRATLLHDGAILLVPAELVWTIALLWMLPRAWDTGSGRRQAVFAGALTVIIMFLLPIIQVSRNYFFTRTQQITTPRGSLALDQRGVAVRELLTRLRHDARPGESLAVLPEGAMLNFLSGHANPTPYVNLLVREILVDGEERIVQSFSEHPPDWIAFVHRPAPEYEVAMFCDGYGRKLCAWINAHYTQQALFGAVPNRDDRFGILLLRHMK